jgi:antitoxin component of MazEF toxin-antitoxin module
MKTRLVRIGNSRGVRLPKGRLESYILMDVPPFTVTT